MHSLVQCSKTFKVVPEPIYPHDPRKQTYITEFRIWLQLVCNYLSWGRHSNTVFIFFFPFFIVVMVAIEIYQCVHLVPFPFFFLALPILGNFIFRTCKTLMWFFFKSMQNSIVREVSVPPLTLLVCGHLFPTPDWQPLLWKSHNKALICALVECKERRGQSWTEVESPGFRRARRACCLVPLLENSCAQGLDSIYQRTTWRNSDGQF